MAKWFDKQFELNTTFVSEQKNSDTKNEHNDGYVKKAVNPDYDMTHTNFSY